MFLANSLVGKLKLFLDRILFQTIEIIVALKLKIIMLHCSILAVSFAELFYNGFVRSLEYNSQRYRLSDTIIVGT